LVLQRTPRRGKWNIFFGAMILMFGLLLFLFGFDARRGELNGAATFFIFWMVIFSVLMLVNTLRGATCRLRLRPAVQEEELAACQRLPRALNAIDLIAARASAIQKRPSQEEIAALAAPAPPPAPDMSPSPGGAPPAEGAPAVPGAQG